MANLRKGSCYRDLTRSYTRKSKFKRYSFIPTVPDHKIVKFNIGNPNKEFKYKIKLVSRENLNVRHNSIESVRQMVNRILQKDIGISDYYFVIKAFPHHVLRENKLLSGAGADRMQTGMSHAFGKPIGRAARMKKGKTLLTISVNENGKNIAERSLKKAIPRLPGKYSIEVEKLK